MKAYIFDGVAGVREVPKPTPSDDEALIRVKLAGVCKTDLEIVKGYMDYKGALGHEFVGVVEEATNHALIGKRVVGEINAGCGECSFCRRGMERHCPNRTVLGILGRQGAMSEYLTLPESNLCVVPESLTDEKAAFVEPLAAALEILEQTQVAPDQRVLVIGDGKLGLLVSMVLRLTGCNLITLGKHSDKLKILENLGISTILLNDAESLSGDFHMVVEASGKPAGWSMAMSMVRPRGKLVLKSTYQGAFDFNPAAIVINEITVVGSRCGRFEPALRLLEMGLIDPSPLLSDILPLDKAEDAFERSRDGAALKILLRP